MEVFTSSPPIESDELCMRRRRVRHRSAPAIEPPDEHHVDLPLPCRFDQLSHSVGSCSPKLLSPAITSVKRPVSIDITWGPTRLSCGLLRLSSRLILWGRNKGSPTSSVKGLSPHLVQKLRLLCLAEVRCCRQSSELLFLRAGSAKRSRRKGCPPRPA